MVVESAEHIVSEAAVNAVQIERVERRHLLVPIVGTSPLIVHGWDSKAKQQMLDAQQGKKKQKVVRDPAADFKAAQYRLPDGRHGFRAVAFKSCIVGGARFYGKETPMTLLRRAIFISGEGPEMLLPLIINEEPTMREDMVRVGMGGTDLRYRPQYSEWKVVLPLTYTPALLSQEKLLGLIDAGGSFGGVGEWRPEKDGVYGTFTIDESENIVEVKA